MKRFVIAWDLDGTLIDSSHRTKIDENGFFDLEYWLNNCRREKIFKDTLLPLSKLYFEYKKTGFTQICVTARTMSTDDFDFLEKQRLDFELILHRKDSLELDSVLKNEALKDFLKDGSKFPFQAYDDKKNNLDVFDKHGFRTFNAFYLNQVLKEENWQEIKKKRITPIIFA